MSDRYGITYDGYEFKVSQIAGVTVGGYKTVPYGHAEHFARFGNYETLPTLAD